MSSFLSWLKPMSQEEEDEVRRCLKERSQRLEKSGYDATRDGPRDVALALRLGELLRQDSVKEWCSKDGPDAAEFAKTYLDLLQDSWGSPVTGLFKISNGLSGAAGPLAPISQYLRNGFAASRDIAAASQHRLAVDHPKVPDPMPQVASDEPRGLQSGTVQSQHDMDTLSNKELIFGMGKNLWDIARMAKLAFSPKVLKFFWHIRRRDAELTARELEEIRVEINEVLLKSTKEDGSDSATRVMLEHLNETFREMTETILKSQQKQDVTASSGTVIQSGISEPISARLHTVDINQGPSYMALSYVWFDPRISLYQKSQVKSQGKQHELICDGESIPITENLHNALRALFTLDGDGQSTASRLGCDRLWVDQLCINQQDDVEKSSQVAFMGQIYKSAKAVISWLGPEDSHTKQAHEVITALSSIPKPVYTSASYDPASEMKRFSSVAWMSAVVLLSLPYFQRAWIVQELAFARENTMVWGSQVFVWKDIRRATKYLSSNNTWALLRREVDAFKPMWEHLESQSSKLSAEPLSSAIELHVTIKNLAFRALSPESPYKLLMAGRLLQAKDHRDKFFAMLDLAKTSAQRLGTRFPNFKPDYNKSIEQVIKEFTVEFIKAKGDLTILTQVEDRSLRNKRTLPSWMPDFTAALLPLDLLGASQKKRWKADGGAQRGIKIVAANSVLAVHGHKADTIQATAVSFNNIMANGDWRSILALTKSLYKMDGPHVNYPADDRLLSALLCSSSVLKMNKDSKARAQLKAEFADWMINKLRVIEEKSRWDPTAAVLLAKRELDEMNDYLKENISDPNAPRLGSGLPMPNLTKSDEFRKMMFSGPQTETISSRDAVALIDATKSAMTQLWELNQDGFFPSPSQIRETLRAFQPAAVVAPNANADERQQERQRIQDRAKKFELSMGSHLEARVLFRSASGYLGLAPQSAEAGRDEVWVLAGLPVPIVLRPWHGAMGDNAYQVVGHCYLPNRMMADAAKQPPDYFQPLHLV
ncbi:unnamed protein product [Clonostachys rhizophaga]|uniref:Heterokaryon incompatibility domain-containing protein n=1 Tax=Clonostachys rhizophaga TaxID=160324 RepID=A0A9N9V722_9HYPO|nr:unnamed protein product [Clonostachys rhizophaga]